MNCVVSPFARLCRTASRIAPYLGVFVCAVLLIIALTWPWCLHWQNEFLAHWDPPFHAWKLEFMARRILAGDLFIRSGNTNLLYPHSGALYFEALQWPQAVFAALLLGVFHLSPTLTYHLTLVLFWAFSAPCTLFLLRQLRCRKEAAFAGAVLFCILPYRISYMVEFQMELPYAIPLVYAFLVRFFHTCRKRDAILLALSWWLLAVTELYEAVFILLTLPFLAIAFFATDPKILAKRTFYTAGVWGIVAGLASLPVMLLPYLAQSDSGAVARPLKEVFMHSAQPFSYVLPWGRFFLWKPTAYSDEFSLYPTLVVLALSLYALFHWYSSRKKQPVTDNRPLQANAGVLSKLRMTVPRRIPRIAVGTGFAFIAFLILLQCRAERCTPAIQFLINAFLILIAICLLLVILFAPPRESTRSAFLRGLGAAAVFCTVLSWGPDICLGASRRTLFFQADNSFFLSVYKVLFPVLSHFRVMSRFGVIVLFFLVCAATCALDILLQRMTGKRFSQPWMAGVISALAIALCAIECIPPSSKVHFFLAVDEARKSPAMNRLFENHPIRTLAALPMGNRNMEGMRMFSLLKGDFPYVYAWGGYFPEFSQEIVHASGKGFWNLLHEQLSSLYPPCLVFRDRRYAFDDSPRTGPDGRREDLYSFLVPVDNDSRFTLYEISPLPPAKQEIRRFQTDVGQQNSVLCSTVKTSPGISVRLSLNETILAHAIADASGIACFRYDLSEIPAKQWSANGNNRLQFEIEDDASEALLSVTRFSLLGQDGSYHDPCAPYTGGTTRFSPETPYRPNQTL